jgi:hypothetical protein
LLGNLGDSRRKVVISEESRAVSANARRIYESQLRKELEEKHSGRYVCIEPVSGSYFLGDTFDGAVNAAIDVFPNRLTHTLRIGHPAALHLGVLAP